jgi:hypothetical protein
MDERIRGIGHVDTQVLDAERACDGGERLEATVRR